MSPILIATMLVLGPPDPKSLYEFVANDIDGKPAKLSLYKGKVALVVNVASKCGLTPQYKALQDLFESKKKAGLVILGFPANDFAGQEPGTNGEIKQFCKATYGVSFPMFSKVTVKGSDKAPIYKWLIGQSDRPSDEIEWNFAKFVVGRDGKVLARFAPQTKPDDPQLLAVIDRALSAK